MPSLFQRLLRRPAKPARAAHEPADLLPSDATRPLVHGRDFAGPPPPVEHAVNRRAERLERRELLYAVVRDTMVRAGVLSASYKFKVLALDPQGRQFLVMIDVARDHGGDTARLSETEALLAQTAKARHDILVTAVYWRINDHVAVGQPRRSGPAGTPAAPPAAPAPRPAAQPVRAAAYRPEPIGSDEMAAFQRALARGTAAAPAEPPARSALRRPPAATGFEDTEVPDGRDPRPQGLSTTQYGDLI
ncbi:hypothetical protein [Xylophilus sp.]|uniref:hypothetical protein n=1 Tax=Xylophilus sp. TaxID=2653893 RepID=UPI0013B91E6C|nr:hypothetical protein [Xylophilus sp.]KAF1045903.1 MAG: hypothetical protein GAK38_02738 [Xylophilus sp.]